MYLVGYGVQSSAWQIRVPAAEFAILNHYGANSTVKTVLDMISVILQDINRSRKLRKQHVSYIFLSEVNFCYYEIFLDFLQNHFKIYNLYDFIRRVRE